MKKIILFLAFSVCANIILAQENNAEQFEVYFYNNSGYTLYVYPYPISMTFNGSNYYSLMSENPNSNFNHTMYYDYNNAIRNELIGSNMLTLDSITLANGDSKGLKFDCHLCNTSSNAFGNKGYCTSPTLMDRSKSVIL